MTLEKKVASRKVETINKLAFVKGQKFILDKKVWTVAEVTEADNTSMREVVADDGTREVVTLATLLKDVEANEIQFI